MIEEKLQFRQRIMDVGVWVEMFFRIKTNKTTGFTEFHSYPKFQGVLVKIEEALEICLGYAFIIINYDIDLVDSCREEISVFYDTLFANYYDNYKRELPKGVFKYEDGDILTIDFDSEEQQAYKRQFLHTEYKLVLYDMLNLFKSKFEDIFQKKLKENNLASDTKLNFEEENTKSNDDYKPVFDRQKIVSFYYFLIDEYIIEPMSSIDAFLKCFDFKKETVDKPKIPRGKLQLFVYALSLIPQMNEKIALKSFGIKLYNQLKGKNYLTKVERNDLPILSFRGEKQKLAYKIKNEVEKMSNLT